MKKICVILDDYAENLLQERLDNHNETISDIVICALIAYCTDNPDVVKESHVVLDKIRSSEYGSIAAWCEARLIKKKKLFYLLERTANGHTVSGFGNYKHKNRDSDDGRLFKTHTAWIAHCIKQDFGIDIC